MVRTHCSDLILFVSVMDPVCIMVILGSLMVFLYTFAQPRTQKQKRKRKQKCPRYSMSQLG